MEIVQTSSVFAGNKKGQRKSTKSTASNTGKRRLNAGSFKTGIFHRKIVGTVDLDLHYNSVK